MYHRCAASGEAATVLITVGMNGELSVDAEYVQILVVGVIDLLQPPFSGGFLNVSGIKRQW